MFLPINTLRNIVHETGEINIDQILKGHVSQVKKFRFYLKGSEDPVAD